MSTNRSYVSATLTADENKAAIEAHLHEILERSLTPMEPGQAKVLHGTHSGSHGGGSGCRRDNLPNGRVKHASTAYMIRLAVLTQWKYNRP